MKDFNNNIIPSSIQDINSAGFVIEANEFSVGRKGEEFIRIYMTAKRKEPFSMEDYGRIHALIERLCDGIEDDSNAVIDHINFEFVKEFNINDLSYGTTVVPSKEELKGFIIEHIDKTKSEKNTKTRPAENFWRSRTFKVIDILMKKKKRKINHVRKYDEYIGDI